MIKQNSIRWRLVLSYVLLTLLTVALVGLLSLQLVENYIHAQTQTQLQSNAQAVAQQAVPMLSPFPQQEALQDLARSVAFMGRMRVKIYDPSYNVIADSGLPEPSTSVVWVQPDPSQGKRPAVLMPLAQAGRGSQVDEAWMRENIGRQPSLVLRIEEGAWGRQVIFETFSSEDVSPTPAVPSPGSRIEQWNTTGRNAGGQSVSSQELPSTDTSALIPIGDQQQPVGYVELNSPRTSGEQIIAAMRRALLLAGAGAALIAVIAGLLVSRGLTAPILALAESANRMSSGNLSARAPERGAGEIGQLARQFNLMAGRLQSSFAALSAERDALRRFIADASHELRTPVTALGNFIELLQGPAAEDAEARAEFLAESQNQVRRMDWIIANLLDLSRLDAGLVALDVRPHDLGEVLQSASAPFLPQAKAKGQRLEILPPEMPVQITCDRARMEMAIGNLLDNALKFTPPGGQVRLTSDFEAEGISIQVKDSGPGIPAEDLPHIFERFYRGRGQQTGSGLGLAIVQSILQAHGGSTRAESEPGQGSRFILSLPDREKPAV